MGCNTSKLDRLPAVALCRERCKFLDEALRQSYALADAHVAHMHSLKTLSSALLCFFHHFQDSDTTNIPPIQANDDAAINDAKTSPPSLSHSSSFSSDVLLHSESEPEQDTDKDNRDTVSSAPDDVAFMHYVHPLYAPFSPPLPNYYGGSSGSKPPSPPRSSAWDFLNFFEPYERYHEPYSQSGEADEVATEEQGKAIIIGPQNEAEKKCNDGGDRKVVSEAENNSKEGGSVEEKVDLVSKKKECVVSDSDESSNTSTTAKVKAGEGLCGRMKKIQNLFDSASDSGNSILELLDVGKLRYYKKLAFNLPYPAVSCKMMNVFVNPSIPSNPLVFKCMETSLLGSRRALNGHAYGNLCSTLKRLCMWEKKLYHEVKAEEKLRILHQNKCRQLRRMNKKDNNADAQKVESVKTLIGILATKMKISIQVVDKISNTICKLREEELWPQITRFILMFLGMWKDMVECYRCHHQEIAEAKSFDASPFSRKLGNDHIDAAIKLKSEVQNWNLSFSDWIYAQKCYVKALNGWLVRCLLYEPEELPDDDTTPFSPSKIGAPPVFVICNKWSRAMDDLSEKNVSEAVDGFMLRLNEILEKCILDQQQKLTLGKEIEKKVKMLMKQEHKMHKIVKARERKMVPVARDETDAVHHGDLVDTVSLQSGLKQIFASMESFTATTAGFYQQLYQQINNQNSSVL